MTATPPEPEPYITLAEAAAHLGVKRSWLYNRQDLGIPKYRVGRTLRFRVSELDAWMESRRAA
jgi:excisionase family DNA binding protein